MRKTIFLVASLIPLTVIYAACSSDDSTVTVTPPANDAAAADVVSHDAKKVPTDTGVVPSDDGNTCVPGDVTGFTNTFVPPVHDPNACTDVQIADLLANCFDTTTQDQTKCNAWRTNNTTCDACMESQEDPNATSYGALIGRTSYTSVNVTGCKAIVLQDATQTGCAAKEEAADACERAACDTNCPISSDADFPALQSCEASAGKAGCKSFVQGECTAAEAGTPDSGFSLGACLGTGAKSFEAYVALLAPIFCGGKPAPADAGSDASADASDGN